MVENDNGPKKVTGDRMTNYKQGCQRASRGPQFHNSTLLQIHKSTSLHSAIMQFYKLQIHVATILHSTIAIFVPESTMPFGAISLVPTSANTQTVPRQRLAPKMSKYRNTRGRQRGSKENWLFAYSRTIANSSLLPVFTFIAGIVRIEIILIIYQHDDHQHNHDQTDVGVVGTRSGPFMGHAPGFTASINDDDALLYSCSQNAHNPFLSYHKGTVRLEAFITSRLKPSG